MANLPGSGQLNFSQIQGTFGGGNPISFSEYFKGGEYVKNTAINPNGIPPNGQISVSKFWGAGPGAAGYTIITGHNIAWDGVAVFEDFIGYVGDGSSISPSGAYVTGLGQAATITGAYDYYGNGHLYNTDFAMTSSVQLPNNDTTFSSINIGGHVFARRNANFQVGQISPGVWGMFWYWNEPGVVSYPDTGGSVNLQVLKSSVSNNSQAYSLTVGHGVDDKYGIHAWGWYGPSLGSMSSTAYDTYTNGTYTVVRLYWSSDQLQFALQRGSAETIANNDSNFSSVTVNGVTFTRSSAAGFNAANSVNGGGNTWYWNTTTNPFGTTAGAVVPVTIAHT